MQKSKKLNILHLPKWFPDEKNSIGNFVERHILCLENKTNNYIIHVVGRKEQQQKYRIYQAESRLNVTRVCYREVPKSKGVTAKVINLLRYRKAQILGYKHLIKTINIKFDLTHIHVLPQSGFLALQLFKNKNTPFVITEHWSAWLNESTTKLGLVEKALSKYIAKRAKRILPVSNYLGNAMQKQGLAKKYTTIHNVVDTTLFQPQELEKENWFLHVSNLEDSKKNISGMLEAANILKTHTTDFTFWFIGAGQGGDDELLKQKTKKLQLEDNVRFLEKTNHSALIKMLVKSKAMVMFSPYETMSCVAAESMSAGIPVITSDGGGISEIVAHRGIIIPNNDITALANAMKNMLNQGLNYSPLKMHQEAISLFQKRR